MTVDVLRRALRHRRSTVAAGVLAGLLVAGVCMLLAPRAYASTAGVYVSVYDGAGSAPSAPVSSLLPQRVTSYSALAFSDRVLGQAVRQGGIGGTTGALADRLTVTSSPDSAVLRLTVTDSDPTRAAATVDAVAGRLVDVVAQLERPQVPTGPPRAALSLVDPGTVDTTPVSPQVGTDLLLGLALGLLAGVAAAVLRTTSDPAVGSPADLAGVVAVPTLGTLPVTGSGARGAVARIRTSLLFADVDEPPRVLTVAGPRAGVGSTTLVCALAEAFASGGRVCLVEGDLRDPVLAERLGLVPTLGLTDVLARRASVHGATQRRAGAVPGAAVDVLVAGGTPHNPTELLSSRTMREVITALRAEYDLVLLDSPPLLAAPDGAVLAGRSDGVVLVGRQAVTTRAQLTSSLGTLTAAGARILGGVLTTATATDPDPEPRSARADGPGGGPWAAPGTAPRLAVPAQPTVGTAGEAAADPAGEAVADPAGEAPPVPPVLRRRGPSRTAPSSPDDPG